MHHVDFALIFGEVLGYFSTALVSISAIRLIFYFHSFLFHWSRYRQLTVVTTEDIKLLANIPNIKVQITTKGLPGSTEVIQRGIRNIAILAEEDPLLYGLKLSVEVVTESWEQKRFLEEEFYQSTSPIQRYVFVTPREYETPKRTKLKARALHYMVELRRQGVNCKPGRTFIVHFDEESVMEPAELRKLIQYLATTNKKLTEGPIFYPLEYMNTSIACQSMEASRPIACFECRRLMEAGLPLMMHGSNLVVDEDFENELGWDIGILDGQPFIAEDYIFGMMAYLHYGPQVFGWHGCLLLEQPTFSLKSAFKQRYRWIFGVLQGITMIQRMSEFHRLPKRTQHSLVWRTHYRILALILATFAALFSILYSLYVEGLVLTEHRILLIPVPFILWLTFVNFLWINLKFVGAWQNLSAVHQLSFLQKLVNGIKIVTVTPFATALESITALWAVMCWIAGKRNVVWQPTPKTKEAENLIHSI